MPAQLIEAHPLVEEARNQVAIKRGPIVYCLESMDLPAGVRVQDIAIPLDTILSPRHDKGLLQGVVVIESEVSSRPSGNWANTLYRPARPGSDKKVNLRFIPYYAWSNRGPSEMTVWLPRK